MWRLWLLSCLMVGVESQAAPAELEKLARGLVAIRKSEGEIFVSWRFLAADPAEAAFNLYRGSDGATPVKLNDQPIRKVTWFLDKHADPWLENRYSVRSLVEGQEAQPSRGAILPPNAPVRSYLEIPLQLPVRSHPNDASVGDLDGDGEYEIVLKSEQRPRDTASTGLTGTTILQGYQLDGSLLWTIDLGGNIREGAHYTQFIVYDLDGDGVAEVACKTADGTVDGRGKPIGDPNADWRDKDPGSRTFGRVLNGPEFLTIFDGRTGAALATADYIPPRGDIGAWGGIGGNGGNDHVGNRVDRFLACVAYLDGHGPSLVMCRGYYGRSVLAAWDWRERRLTSRWVFDSAAPGLGKDGKPNAAYAGMGAHSVSVADVDGDGRDEIIYHSMVVDDDGQGLFTTGLRHGDALHVGDLDPDRPGLEVFGIHENEGNTVRFQTPGTALFDARTGAILWSAGPGADVGRGLCADIDPRYSGSEMWSGQAGLRTCKGQQIGVAPRSVNFAIWWDGDPLRELLDRNQIAKWNWKSERLEVIFTAEGAASNNGSKATPALSADLFGDWREEVMFKAADERSLRIYTTTLPTELRHRTLMQDRQYRLAVAWQNVGYNQPPHPSYDLTRVAEETLKP